MDLEKKLFKQFKVEPEEVAWIERRIHQLRASLKSCHHRVHGLFGKRNSISFSLSLFQNCAQFRDFLLVFF